MSSWIKKIKLINYKRFENFCIIPNEKVNVFVGDNESGKSSILEAIDLVSTGSVRKVESVGLDRLMNSEVINTFKKGGRTFEKLPSMIIELYLEGNLNFEMRGMNNTERINCDGIRLVCSPNMDYRNEILDSLGSSGDYFPFDFYSIVFSTFADVRYTGYKKKINSIFIDSSNMKTEYATSDFVRRMYYKYTEDQIAERTKHQDKYRQMKSEFCSINMSEINGRLEADKNYSFGLKSNSMNAFENDLMIFESGIGIDSKGSGMQVFIKTEFALGHANDSTDLILIEEPENHLSHVNLRKLLHKVISAELGQLFVTTHNSLISTRLELNNLHILHDFVLEQPLKLDAISSETAKFFHKAPTANILEFILSKKTILVEGPSEYILFEKFYENLREKKPDDEGVQILAVRGLSFKRYLEVAAIIGNKVAVVTDNDKNFEKNCQEKYSDYSCIENIEIFFDKDDEKFTFEVALYECNKNLCDSIFGNDAREYMLNNKTDVAYRLLSEENELTVPEYIREAVQWINE